MRMALFPFGVYKKMMVIYYADPYWSDMRRFKLQCSFALYIAMYLLNIYWYTLIVKGLMKMISRMGKPAKKVE